jgi:hypothetical protein
MVKMHGAAGFSTETGAYFIDMAAAPGVFAKDQFGTPATIAKETIPIERFAAFPWSPWGQDNLLPQQMIADIESCGILNAIIDGKARFALCDGMIPAKCSIDKTGKRVVEKIYDDAEIMDFLETNNHFFQTYGWMKDLCGFGNAAARLIVNKDKSAIATFQRDDISEIRVEKIDPKTKRPPAYLYYSANWDLAMFKEGEDFKLPLLNQSNPLKDLQDQVAAGAVEFAMMFRYPGWGKHYYSVPMWYAAYKWVKIAQGVPEMKAALFQNSMRLKYMVVIYEQYWEDAYDNWQDKSDDERNTARNELYTEIDQCLVGAKNHHKTLFVDGKISVDGKPLPYIEVKPIEDASKAGEYLPDSAAANSEIAFSMLFNPAIIGASLPSGPYTNSQGGSNVRESALMQVIIHELERKQVQRVMNVIKYFNGWNITYPGLEFIIPATIMTTLDTGASSKPVVTGGIDQTQNNGNNPNSY